MAFKTARRWRKKEQSHSDNSSDDTVRCCESCWLGRSRLTLQAVRRPRRIGAQASRPSTDDTTVDVDNIVKDLQEKVLSADLNLARCPLQPCCGDLQY